MSTLARSRSGRLIKPTNNDLMDIDTPFRTRKRNLNDCDGLCQSRSDVENDAENEDTDEEYKQKIRNLERQVNKSFISLISCMLPALGKAVLY